MRFCYRSGSGYNVCFGSDGRIYHLYPHSTHLSRKFEPEDDIGGSHAGSSSEFENLSLFLQCLEEHESEKREGIRVREVAEKLASRWGVEEAVHLVLPIRHLKIEAGSR